MVRPVLIAAVIASPVAAATTVQQDFDAAQALLDAGRATEARAAFEALLTRFAPNSQGRAATLVRARLGNALIATGDSEAAEPLLTVAIAGFKADTPEDRDERALAHYDLARAQESRGALDSAAENYRTVLASKIFADGDGIDIALRAALARTLIWSNPPESRRLLDALLALPKEKFGPKGDALALVQTLRGRVELNNGNALEARRWFTLAARSAGGGETSRVNVADVRIRGDLALANYNLGRMDEVQKNVAYSGAGGLDDEGLRTAAQMPLPACAPLTGLAADAVAVVEFAIGSDGRVIAATPIYASRGSGQPVAVRDAGPEVLFPQAVRRWSWSSEAAAKLSGFWRQAVRVELRCFTERRSGDQISLSFRPENRAWAAAAGLRATPEFAGSDAAVLPALRAELNRREREFGDTSVQLIPVLDDIAWNSVTPDSERLAARARLLALYNRYRAPAALIIRARLADIEIDAMAKDDRIAGARLARDRIKALLAEQAAAGAGDSRAAMLTRFRLAQAFDDLRDTAASRAEYETIVARLPADDVIRAVALLRISSMAAAARDTATAASALAATGLSPDQCSLIDTRPQPINTSIGSTAFPEEAQRWRTGGFARVGYDITVDGKPANVRTIVASPPFIFSTATERAVGKFQYRPVFRPGNTLGCTANTQTVRFKVG